jgi:hypothetical protein
MPGMFFAAERWTRMVKEERVTFSGAVPRLWADICRYGEATRSTSRRCA